MMMYCGACQKMRRMIQVHGHIQCGTCRTITVTCCEGGE